MNYALQTASLPVSVGSLDAYIQQVNQIPMLTHEEEQYLAQAFREQNDLEAARKLVMSHLRFVVRVAHSYGGYGLAAADLIQEGNIGLMKAVKRFDPTLGVRLVSFAVHWIKAEIHEFIIRNWRIVKIATTKAQRKLFFNLRNMKKRLGWFTGAEVTDVAKTLKVSETEVRRMEERLNAHHVAFDAPIDADDNDEAVSAPAYYLEDQRYDPARLIEAEDSSDQGGIQLYRAMEKLDQRSQAILTARWLSDGKETLHTLADRFNVSAERIRQLEKHAMNKIKAALVAES
jgi:RNA polymerase sigma-32 factor